MQEPLISGEVWVAWDHTARLANAFNQKPDDFVAFPAPAGPAGRAFMPVIAGMAMPAHGARHPEASKGLVDYMMQPETQVATLRATNFFPVMDATLPEDMPASVKPVRPGDRRDDRRSPDALPALLPVGLGDLGGQFNQVYIDTFERIMLANQDIAPVLDQQGGRAASAIIERGRRALLGAGRRRRTAPARWILEVPRPRRGAAAPGRPRPRPALPTGGAGLT